MPEDLNHLEKKPLFILGHQIKFPKDINFARYGQKAMVKNAIQEAEDMREIVADVIAIYAQPSIDGKFDSANLEPIKKAINSLPIITAWPWAVFFFQEIKTKEESLSLELDRIPKTAEQLKMDNFFEMAGSKRLEKWGDFILIDQLCKTYPQYTHDNIFDMELITVNNLIILNREMAYVNSKTQEIQRKS